MKKIAMCLLAACLSLTFLPLQANAATEQVSQCPSLSMSRSPRSEGGGQKSEGRSRRAEVGEQGPLDQFAEDFRSCVHNINY